ncbi:MAG: hypothetical protein A2252_09420 [Elusimicrobia bacterium RIFOXYA2_FULL_39_19]|nr:MAG: hypothetical protein A2252_09420 [Elusimicrobia bacterium RIFOXYA2_FULL_39_19]
MEDKNIDKNFIGLIISLSASAWQHLGKLENPVTGKVEKSMENAKMSIDMLEMLKDKTKGNLTNEEEKLVDNTLADLKLNYVEEIRHGDAPSTSN